MFIVHDCRHKRHLKDVLYYTRIRPNMNEVCRAAAALRMHNFVRTGSSWPCHGHQSSFSPKCFFLARPCLGQVGLPLIVVVVEQGPDVRLLVFRLRICGSHPIPVKGGIKATTTIPAKTKHTCVQRKWRLTCMPPLPPWWQSWWKPPLSSQGPGKAYPLQSPPRNFWDHNFCIITIF